MQLDIDFADEDKKQVAKLLKEARQRITDPKLLEVIDELSTANKVAIDITIDELLAYLQQLPKPKL